MKHTKQRMYWTPELETKVKELRLAGSSIEAIMRETNLSRGEVYKFLKKNGIEGKEIAKIQRIPKTGKYAHLK